MVVAAGAMPPDAEKTNGVKERVKISSSLNIRELIHYFRSAHKQLQLLSKCYSNNYVGALTVPDLQHYPR